jgi:predicted ABC-type ATPase
VPDLAATEAPILYVLAGPNGAGKTTFFADFIANSGSAIEQVNADSLQAQNPRLSGFELTALAAARIDELRRQRISFSIETNLATEANYKPLRLATSEGYTVRLVYIGLESVAFCQQRVRERVAKGGHDVPPADIEHRYHNSLSLLKQHYREFDQIECLDNSQGTYQRALLITPNGVTRLITPLPTWAEGVAQHIERRARIFGPPLR